MVDRQKLGAWIQPQHLEEGALEQYRKAFTSHPARLVVIKDFLQPQMAERLSRFLSSEAEFKAEYGLYSIEGAVKEEDWLRAKDEDRFFKFGKLVGTPPQFQASPRSTSETPTRAARHAKGWTTYCITPHWDPFRMSRSLPQSTSEERDPRRADPYRRCHHTGTPHPSGHLQAAAKAFRCEIPTVRF